MAATSSEKNKAPEGADSTLIFSLDPLKTGDEFDQWPLHATLLRWFYVPEQYRGAFINALSNHAIDTTPLHVVGGKDAEFGDHGETRVRQLVGTAAFMNLHNEVSRLIERFDGKLSTQWQGDDFKPHVTFQGEEGIKLGQELELKRLHLIRRDDKFHKTVEATFHLSKGSRSAPTARF